MGSATIVYRHVKAPLGSNLSKCGSKLRAIFTSNRISSNIKETDSTSGFELQSRVGYKLMNESKPAVTQEWTVHSNDQAESHSTRAPTRAQIRKTTELHVSRV